MSVYYMSSRQQYNKSNIVPSFNQILIYSRNISVIRVSFQIKIGKKMKLGTCQLEYKKMKSSQPVFNT